MNFVHKLIDNYYNLQAQEYGFGIARPMLAYFQSSNQGWFCDGTGGTCSPLDSLVAPSHIQNLADRSDVISEVQKCSKIQIFWDSIPDPAPTDP